MSATFARPRPTSRRLRTVVLSFVVLALSAVGLSVATPASAATTTIEGTGSGFKVFSMAKGLYRAQLSYADNVEGGETKLFGALLGSDDGQVIEYLAIDRRTEGGSTKVVQLFEDAELGFQVEGAGSDAAWALSFERLSVPTLSQSTLSFGSTGLTSSPLILLKAGTYQATTTFKGNIYDEGWPEFQEFGIAIDLFGAAGDDQTLLESTKTAGTSTRTIKIAKQGVYWVNPFIAATDAAWHVNLVALKNLTAPTPKVSGTAKVGKTLTAKPGTWKPSGVKLSYQWYRGSSKISGATKATYKLTSKDKGAKVKVKVTGSKSGYVTLAKTSTSTATVKK